MKLKYTHKNLLSLTGLAVLWFLIAPDLLAQNGGFAGASTRMGFSARGIAMGNAMSAVTSEGAFPYYNPAQTALLLDSKQTDLTVGALKFDRVFQSTSIQLQLPPTAGLSFSILRTGVKDIDGRTQSGYPTELFDISEYQLASNFGIRLSEKFNAGIGVKFGLANYHEELDNAVSVGIDLGALYHAGDHLNIAFSVKDLFASYSWNAENLYHLDQSRNVVNNFPTRIIFGLAYQADQFTLSGDFELQAYTSETQTRKVFVSNGTPTTIFNTELINTSSTQLRLGGSWKTHERLTIRAGYQLPELTQTESWTLSSGFSIHLPFDTFSPSVDYAFVMEPYRISNMHVFSLRLNL
ncbi:MAG TPA: PorV/PorQ family protein [Gracilimonas sp.]|uniref:PorV/PorQ family protein n=1 Tax=Gracilimonas sp. TaxID=1974203 RepID=UPI002D9648D1|nr:PorV/PorQ family protein [Gracilimonas sp.]